MKVIFNPLLSSGFQFLNDSEIADTFETVSKNLKAYPYVLNYTNGLLTSLVYDIGNSQTITKSLSYTSGVLTSMTLSGNIPLGINITKTFNYLNGNIVSVTYGV